ncbi:MAG TPA: hypothetical protein DEF51_34005 [Myxococcales bacterium]|nr:hypothetical protein [Myxococcales bacterium]
MKRRTPNPESKQPESKAPEGKAPPSRRGRALQVGLGVIFVVALAVGGVYHQVRAQMSETFFGLGDQMMYYAEGEAQDAPRTLLLNGQTIRFSSGHVDQPLREVLDVFERRCGAVNGQLAGQLEELAAAHPDHDHDLPDDSDPTMREEADGEGYVACLDLGADPVSVDELAARIGRYGQTGDVGEIGDMRYVFGEEYEFEGRTRTHFVAMWTNGSFNVANMFPEEGDAPGRDVDDLARPPRATRTLSAWEAGEPQSLAVYWSPGSEVELESHYRRSFAANGWEVIEPETPLSTASDPVLTAEKGPRMVTIVLSPDVENRGATAAVFHSDR